MSRKYFVFADEYIDREVLEDATYVIRLKVLRNDDLWWDVYSDAGLEATCDDHLDAIDYCLSHGAEPFFD